MRYTAIRMKYNETQRTFRFQCVVLSIFTSKKMKRPFSLSRSLGLHIYVYIDLEQHS